jgi:hypothetical protein
MSLGRKFFFTASTSTRAAPRNVDSRHTAKNTLASSQFIGFSTAAYTHHHNAKSLRYCINESG